MLDLDLIRSQFPVFQKNPDIFLDNPAGTQVAQPVIDRMTQYLIETNANHEGLFKTSRQSDAVLDEARAACQAFYNAARPEEIVFGQNMTTITLHLSRSLAHKFNEGDTIVLSRLDHDANITPWTLVAEERGVNIEWIDFDVEDGTLKLDTLEKALEKKPKLVAVGYASNALGTINPVKKITEMSKAAGALVFIDAVQYAPHGVIDVQEIGCDFLISSSYKFFGPHQGILYGRYDLLEELKAYKVRPASNASPGKWETGTQSHEGIAGILGALEYFEWAGDQFGAGFKAQYADKFSGRALKLRMGMEALKAYEMELARVTLETLQSVPGLHVYGLTDMGRLEERVPTFAINLADKHPADVAQKLGEQGIYVWNGNYYALSVTERLGVEESGGMVRIGPVHYNSVEEIEKLGEALKKI